MADRVVEPGKPHWRKSDLPVKNHTRAVETEATYTLTAWPNPPNDEEATHRGQIFECIRKEWTAQVRNIREAATAEAVEADKDDDGQVLLIPSLKYSGLTHQLRSKQWIQNPL